MSDVIEIMSDNCRNDNSNYSSWNTMTFILECVESLIKLKMSISIDLLILCDIYTNYCKLSTF